MSTTVREEPKSKRDKARKRPPSKGHGRANGSGSGDAGGSGSGDATTDSQSDEVTIRTESATETAERARRQRLTTVSAASMRRGNVERVRAIEGGDPGQGGGRSLPGSRLFKKKVGGPAPFVPPKSRMGRRLRAREWSRRGFVQLSPGKQKLRHRILPRTVIGIAAMLMAAGIGAAFSGAAFYAYYDNRLAENERTVARFVEGFDQQFSDAAGALDEVRSESVATIRSELGPLQDYVSDARGVINLPTTAGPSVWLVETRGEDGGVSHGSAFAIVGHRGGTALVTSYQVVVSSASSPGPGIELVKGSTRVEAELWAWDEARDLALLVVDRQIPVLPMAGENAQLATIGGRVFAMSGFGGQNATASPGVLLDHSPVGLQHTAATGSFFNGGPLLNSAGQVVGVASASYNPFEIEPGEVHMAPDVRAICVEILQCSEVVEEVDTVGPQPPQDQTDALTVEVPGEVED